jgi:hypothetical protein
VGEVHANLTQLLQQAGVTTPFTLHSDSSPAIYLTGQPARDTAVTRSFDRALSGIEVTNPLRGRVEPMFNFLTDAVGMKLLHMVSADPNRTPTVVAWGKPDYFVDSQGTSCAPAVAVVETRGSTGPSLRRSTGRGWAWSAPACGRSGATRPCGPTTPTSGRPSCCWPA